MKLIFFVFIILLIQPLAAQTNIKKITYPQPESHEDPRNQYFLGLLNLALSKGSDKSTFRLQAGQSNMQQGRAIYEVVQNRGIDVIWTVTSIEREKQLYAIRVPLMKGLLGYRVFIMRQEDRHLLDKVSTLSELTKYTVGQGHDWPDTGILKANKFNVVTSSTYQGLFTMLEQRRFQLFPRGLSEAWQELDSLKLGDSNLMVEENLMLYYPSPIYFFVNKDNKQLANKIEQGLKLAIADGSFEEYFLTFLRQQNIVEQANFKHRTVIQLDNPLLPENTPLEQKGLWY